MGEIWDVRNTVGGSNQCRSLTRATRGFKPGKSQLDETSGKSLEKEDKRYIPGRGSWVCKGMEEKI